MVYYYKIFLVVVFSISLFGCASSRKETRVTDSFPSEEKYDESFDPLLLNDEDITFKKPVNAIEISDTILIPDQDSNEQEIIEENKLIDGFRIQVISTKDLENAARAKAIAIEQFEDLEVKFYLEFDSPYYKVRIGDFKTRGEAESSREIIRSRGYPKAWIVKTKIWSNPDFPGSGDSTNTNLPEVD